MTRGSGAFRSLWMSRCSAFRLWPICHRDRQLLQLTVRPVSAGLQVSRLQDAATEACKKELIEDLFPMVAAVNAVMRLKRDRASTSIQSVTRTLTQMQHYQIALSKVRYCQRLVRGAMARRRYRNILHAHTNMIEFWWARQLVYI